MQPTLLESDKDAETNRHLLYCDPQQVIFEKRRDGHFLNIRGKVQNTTDLEASVIAANNRILKPVQLRLNQDGTLICVDGHRRTIVARKRGLPLPYFLLDDPNLDTVDHMLASNVRKQFPYLLLNKDGHIIGGLAFAVCQKIQQGRTPMQIAQLMGYKTDKTVKLLIDLHHADISVRRAVAVGRMSLKAFSTIRHTPVSQQTAVLDTVEASSDEGEEVTFTKDKLRQAAKKQKQAGQTILVTSDEPTVVQQLNRIKNSLATLLHAQTLLGPREKSILTDIKELAHV